MGQLGGRHGDKEGLSTVSGPNALWGGGWRVFNSAQALPMNDSLMTPNAVAERWEDKIKNPRCFKPFHH